MMQQKIINAFIAAGQEDIKVIPGVVITPNPSYLTTESLAVEDEVETEKLANELIDEIDSDESVVVTPMDIIAEVLAFGKWTNVEDSLVPVAYVVTPGGLKFVVADTDADGIYDMALTCDGELFALFDEIIVGKQWREFGITISDLENLADDSFGYLSPNEYDKRLMDENHPDGEITDTEP